MPWYEVPMARKKQVVFIIFENFNTLDLNGPQEVLKNYAMGATQDKQLFDISVAAASDITTTFEQVQIKRNISLDDALKSMSSFDIMIVAGAPDIGSAINGSDGPEILSLIKAFGWQKVDGDSPKWLVSICTGAGFLATSGLFGGKTVTSHWAYLKQLQEICNKFSNPPTKVIRERWVDAGVLDGGVRLVTSGAVSCGIDCCLWLVSEIAGPNGIDVASSVAAMMDYDWKYTRPGYSFTVGYQL